MSKLNQKKYAAINLPSREVKLTDSLESAAPWTHLLTEYDYTVDNSVIRISGMNNSTGETCSIVMTNYILII